MVASVTFGVAMPLASSQFYPPEALKIVTVNSPGESVLKQKTEDIQSHEAHLSKEIGEKLYLALKPHFPAAGLAAPQIGIGRSVFIFSFDRDPKNLEVVINPTMKPVGNAKVEGWEGCFSILLGGVWKLAKVPRYETIDAAYLTTEGKKVERRLDGFAAKVFQHEYDHLQGIETIDREDAVVKEFSSEEELMNFLAQVKKEDSKRYNR